MGWKITKPNVIYAIRCTLNDKVYIGRSYRFEARIREHFLELRKGKKTEYRPGYGRVSSDFQVDYNKYGEEYFEVYVLETDVPPEKCKEREAYWIKEYNSTSPQFGYNKLDERLFVMPEVIKGTPPKVK